MNVLVAHEFYQQPGGEDQCVAAEIAMLRAHGHEVTEYYVRNEAIDGMGRLGLAARTVWSGSSYRELRRVLRRQRPQVAHFHNTLPLISPAAYWAARAEGVRVVQTLHNFRLVCPNALLFRDGRVCEDCLGHLPWPGIRHGCYRGSRAASTAVAAMLAAHRALGTWSKAVDRYVALTEFSRSKLVDGGLPARKVATKANFVYPDPGPGPGGGYALFVGRLAAEKGLRLLLDAWPLLDGTVPLKIVGDGPLAPAVRAAVGADAAIEWLGPQPLDSVYRLIGEAAFLVLPSECYENFPRVLIEAFAKGTPVLASRLGAMAELVEDGRTGWLFAPGDAAALAAAVRRALADASALAGLRQAARRTYEERFTAERNHRDLIAIYRQALGENGTGA